jgi:endonuclease YncB( thermonuclease family)
MLRPTIAGLLALWCALPACAHLLQGQVVGITDGDTLTVLDATQRTHKIRLAGIDAPEHNQAFGQRAKQHLSALVFGQHVDVHWDKLDRYQRTVGKVMAAPPSCSKAPALCTHTVDINHALIAAGMAWWYKKYAAEQPPADAALYERTELQAHQARLGLWSEPAPMPPWQWRQAQKPKPAPAPNKVATPSNAKMPAAIE